MTGQESVTVVQVIGRPNYRRIKVAIRDGANSGVIEAAISGDAYCRYLSSQGKKCELVLIVPESIVTYFASIPEEAAQLIIDKDSMRGLVSRITAADLGSGSGSVRIVVVPSIGNYKKHDGTYSISFRCAGVSDIRLKIALELLRDALEGKRIVVDTSTGHNVYVGALMRALRDLQILAVASKISEADTKPLGAPDYEIATLEPVSELTSAPVNYVVDRVTIEAFFHFPISKGDIANIKNRIFADNCIASRDRGGDNEIVSLKVLWSKLGINRWLSTGLTLYNAVAYNAPLAFLELGKLYENELGSYPLEAAVKIADSLSRYLDGAAAELTKNEVIVTKRHLNRQKVMRVLIALVMTDSLYKLWRGLYPIIRVEDGYSLNNILKTFANIYRNLRILGPSTHVLTTEINNIKKVLREIPEELKSEWTLLAKLDNRKGNDKNNKEKDSKDEWKGSKKRNFFAHAGFLKDITEVKTKNGDVLVRYKSGKTEWMSFLRNPS